MKSSRDEIIRLLWTLAGAIFGVAVGFALNTLLQQLKPAPSLSFIIVIVTCGGGLVGGGYLTLWVITKRQKAARKKYFEGKKKKRKGKR